MPKISPIYNLITELKQENNNLADRFLDLESDHRNYFLFKLSTDIKSVLDEDYELEEAHFSIDKEYNNSQHGYTPIHYTQNYFSKSKNKYIVIHGFLSAQGEFLHSQAKELDDKKIFTGTYVDLTSDEEAILKTHIEKHTPVLEPIFTEKKAREKQLKKESENLDWELTTLSQSLDFEETRKEYIEKARQFIDTIQRLNRYSETQDKRNLFLFNMIEQIEKIDACSQQKPISKKSEKEPLQEVFEIKGEIQQSESIEDLYTQAITKFSEIIAEFQGYKPDLLKKKHELANALHEQLFVIYYFPEALLTDKDKQKIKEALSHINAFYEKKVNLLTKEALKGNLKKVIELFPICSRYIKSNLYESLVDNLIEKKWDSLQENILQVCDYLSENDSRYKAYIEVVEKRKYPISKKDFEKLINALRYEEKDIETILTQKEYNTSLLFQLHLNDKKTLFEAFLRHGASPETWGLEVSTRKEGAFSLFYDISTCHKGDYLDYLSLLLQYNVNPSNIFTEELLNKKAHKKLELPKKTKFLDKKLYRICNANPKFLHTPVQILNYIPKLELEFWKKLMQKASLSDLVFCLTTFCEYPLIEKQVSFSNQYTLEYAATKEQAIQYLEKAPYKSGCALFLYQVFYPNLEKESNQYTYSIYRKMKLLEEYICTRIKKLDQNKFKEQYKIVFNIAETEFRSANHFEWEKSIFENILEYFLGCEYLLMKYAALTLEHSTQRMFIQQYSTELYDYIFMCIKKSDNKEQEKNRLEYYTQIRESFSKRHTPSADVPLPLLEHVQGGPNILHCAPLTKPSKSKFLIDHYASDLVYNESEFNKPKKIK